MKKDAITRNETEPSRFYAFLAETFPEFHLLPNDAERRRLLKYMRRSVFIGNPWFYIYVFGFLALTLAIVRLFQKPIVALLLRIGVPPLVGLIALIVLMIFGYYGGMSALFQFKMRRVLRRRLQELGVAVCVKCGYDCRQLQEPRCPECGRVFDAELLGRQ